MPQDTTLRLDDLITAEERVGLELHMQMMGLFGLVAQVEVETLRCCDARH